MIFILTCTTVITYREKLNLKTTIPEEKKRSLLSLLKVWGLLLQMLKKAKRINKIDCVSTSLKHFYILNKMLTAYKGK